MCVINLLYCFMFESKFLMKYVENTVSYAEPRRAVKGVSEDECYQTASALVHQGLSILREDSSVGLVEVQLPGVI